MGFCEMRWRQKQPTIQTAMACAVLTIAPLYPPGREEFSTVMQLVTRGRQLVERKGKAQTQTRAQPTAKRPFSSGRLPARGEEATVTSESLVAKWHPCRPPSALSVVVFRTQRGEDSVFAALERILVAVTPGLGSAELKRLVYANMSNADLEAAACCTRAAIRSGKPCATSTGGEYAGAVGCLLRAGAAVHASRRGRPEEPVPRAEVVRALQQGVIWPDSWVVARVSAMVPEVLFAVVDQESGGETSIYWAGVASCHGEAGLTWSPQFTAARRPPKAMALLLRTHNKHHGPHFEAMTLAGQHGMLVLHDSVRNQDLPFPLDASARPGNLRVAFRPSERVPEPALHTNRLLRAFGAKDSRAVPVFADVGTGKQFAVSPSAEGAVAALLGSRRWTGIDPVNVGHGLLAILGPAGNSPAYAEQAVVASMGPVDCYRIPELAAVVPPVINAQTISHAVRDAGWSLSGPLVEAASRVAVGTAVVLVDATTGCSTAIASPACPKAAGGAVRTVSRVVVVLVGSDEDLKRAVVVVPEHSEAPTRDLQADLAAVPVQPRATNSGQSWTFGQLVLHRACLSIGEHTHTRSTRALGVEVGYRTLPGAGCAGTQERTAAIAAALGVQLTARPGVLRHCIEQTAALLRSSNR